jgi:hypothetical protein
MPFRLANTCSEETLRNVPLPNRTVSYTPVPNELIFDVLHEQLDKYNLKVKQTDLTMSTGGKRFIGLYDIDSDDEELGYRIGFKNSYDGSMAFGMGIGSVVWICSNGLVHGEIANKRIHTGNADDVVEEMIKIGVEQYQIKHSENEKIKRELREIYCDTNEIFKMLGKICMTGTMNGNELTRMKKEINSSKTFTNLTTSPGGFTAWDLYNHGTEVLKGASFNTYFDKHNNIHKLFVDEFGL